MIKPERHAMRRVFFAQLKVLFMHLMSSSLNAYLYSSGGFRRCRWKKFRQYQFFKTVLEVLMKEFKIVSILHNDFRDANERNIGHMYSSNRLRRCRWKTLRLYENFKMALEMLVEELQAIFILQIVSRSADGRKPGYLARSSQAIWIVFIYGCHSPQRKAGALNPR